MLAPAVAYRWGTGAIVMLALTGAACGGQSGRGAELRLAEQRWIRAQQFRDSTALDRVLAPEFILTEGDSGAPVPRDRYIAGVLHSGAHDSIGMQDLRVTHHGDSATINARFSCRVSRDGQPAVRYEFRTTDRWIRRGGRWLAVSRTMVVPSD